MVWCILTVCWFIFMNYLSHQDGRKTRQTSRFLARILRFISTDTLAVSGTLRIVAHYFLYLVFTLLVVKDVEYYGLSPWLFLFPFVWSFIDEIAKEFTPGRHFHFPDVLRNLAGCGIGMIFVGIEKIV